MDVQTVVSLIGTVGFPIVAYFHQAMRYEKVLGDNTQALNHLAEKIGGSNK